MGPDGRWYYQTLTTTSTTTTTFDTTWYQQMGIDTSSINNANIKPNQTNLYNTLTNSEFKNGGAMNTYGNTALLNMQGNVLNYEGEFNALNQRHGEGTASFANGDTYKGEWSNNLRDGYGTLNYLSGDIYRGEFKNGFPNGRGQYIYNNAAVVAGEDNADGASESDGDSSDGAEKEIDITKSASKIITGTFEQGKPSGCCVVSYPKTDKQEVIVYKKGIKVEKDDEIGLEGWDLALAIWNVIGFIALFIVLPVFLVVDKYIAYLPEIYPPIAIVWIIYMCCATCCNNTASYINNM